MKIVIFGDSISTHIEMKNMTEDLLAQAHISGEVICCAVAGEDTNAAMKRLADIVAQKADYYYIFFGANDAAVHRKISPQQFFKNITTFITALGAQKTSILTPSYVNEVAMMNSQKMLGRSNTRLIDYVESVKAAGEKTGANVLNLNALMHQQPNPDELIVSDGVHFTTKGYKLVTSLIAQDIINREQNN